jgi:hypothetical protein
MKRVILFSLLVLIGMVSFSKNSNESNLDIVKMLKSEKFNLEFYELSFCIEEVLNIIETDSSFCNIWDARIAEGFSKRLEDEIIYIHFKELEFLKYKLNSDENLKLKYPYAYEYVIKSIDINIDLKKGMHNFPEIFNTYIKYPEQIDDICIIMLICDFDCMVFKTIQNDKISNWKFNNWLEYGFEEFRYFPSTQNQASNILTNRITKYIIENPKCINKPLVIKSIEMIQATMNKYPR